MFKQKVIEALQDIYERSAHECFVRLYHKKEQFFEKLFPEHIKFSPEKGIATERWKAFSHYKGSHLIHSREDMIIIPGEGTYKGRFKKCHNAGAIFYAKEDLHIVVESETPMVDFAVAYTALQYAEGYEINAILTVLNERFPDAITEIEKMKIQLSSSIQV